MCHFCIFHSEMPGYFPFWKVYEILANPTSSQVPDEPVLSTSLTRYFAARRLTEYKVMKAQPTRVSRETVGLPNFCSCFFIIFRESC